MVMLREAQKPLGSVNAGKFRSQEKLAGGDQKRHMGEVMKADIIEKGITKDLVKDRLHWMSISKNSPTHASM